MCYLASLKKLDKIIANFSLEYTYFQWNNLQISSLSKSLQFMHLYPHLIFLISYIFSHVNSVAQAPEHCLKGFLTRSPLKRRLCRGRKTLKTPLATHLELKVNLYWICMLCKFFCKNFFRPEIFPGRRIWPS